MSSLGFGRSTLIVGGSVRWCTAITALNSPADPAAALVWPIWDLTEPRAHHWRSARPAASNARRRPPNSAASPALVPVPWASISSTVSAPKPARAYARSMARACPSDTGAYTLFDRPSLLVPTARITA